MVAEIASQSQVFKSYRGGCGIASRRGIAVPTATGSRDIRWLLIISKRGRGGRSRAIRQVSGMRWYEESWAHPEVKKTAGFYPQVFLKDSRTAVQQDSENRTSQQLSGMTVGRIDGATTGTQSKFEVLILLLPTSILRWKQTRSYGSQFFVGSHRDNCCVR